ncbi:hypothetical protein H0H81_008165 [Sphagnurus paluster]|uniref:VWFA domain-containing protein n=1 Tax=Sphagnurus paluster TaxID=117069 RepID=A0A9P7GQD7_9AGAR|nr:hypothetical protein H0H81_008165 [Sphagnurus paluster]
MGSSSSKAAHSSSSNGTRSRRNVKKSALGSSSSSSRNITSSPVGQMYMPVPHQTAAPIPVSGSMGIPAPEDVLLSLARFDTVLLIDDSGSMSGSRWTTAGNALATLATVASRYDADGIDIEFLNSQARGSEMKNAEAVGALFASVTPRGQTPLGTRLDAIRRTYHSRLESQPERTKPLNLIVITDGAPTDGSATEDAILRSARALDARHARTTQLGIQFVQIGNDIRARAYLETLDDGLAKYGVRDMVDTTLSGTGNGLDLDLVKILFGAVNRRVDNKGSAVLVRNS